MYALQSIASRITFLHRVSQIRQSNHSSCALLSVIKHPLSRSIGANVPLEHAVYSLDLPLKRWKYDEDMKKNK
jgi:hypothetical protein